MHADFQCSCQARRAGATAVLWVYSPLHSINYGEGLGYDVALRNAKAVRLCNMTVS